MIKPEDKKENEPLGDGRNTFFFLETECDADYKHWWRMPIWSDDDAVALSLGKDPRRVQWQNIKAYLGTSAFAQEYKNRLDVLHLIRHEDGYDPDCDLVVMMYPFEYVDHLERLEYEGVAALKAHMPAPKEAPIDWEQRYNTLNQEHQILLKKREEPLQERERNNLYKMILGMAIEKYNYRPEEEKNGATGKKRDSIHQDLKRLGIKIDSKTILSHLRKAKDSTEFQIPK